MSSTHLPMLPKEPVSGMGDTLDPLSVIHANTIVCQFHESSFYRFEMEGAESKVTPEPIKVFSNPRDVGAAESSSKCRGSTGDV